VSDLLVVLSSANLVAGGRLVDGSIAASLPAPSRSEWSACDLRHPDICPGRVGYLDMVPHEAAPRPRGVYHRVPRAPGDRERWRRPSPSQGVAMVAQPHGRTCRGGLDGDQVHPDRVSRKRTSVRQAILEQSTDSGP
jgi:hypothetical protein